MSVIIPVYNCDHYIKDCLDSVIHRNKVPLEVICIDDGSTDNSLEIIRKYQNTHNCISVISKPNEGLSIARNVGLQHAHGTYVQFLDSDDKLESGALDRLFQVSKEQDLDILFFNAKTFYDEESLKQSFPQFEKYYITKADLSQPQRGLDLLMTMCQYGEYRSSVWGQFFKRSFLTANNLTFQKYILHEDNLFTFQCLCRARLAARINESLYCRRIRQNSIMTSTIKFANVYGYLRCYMGMLNQVLSMKSISKEQEYCLKSITDSIARAVILNYGKLDVNEQKKIASLTPMEHYFFDLVASLFQKEAEKNLTRQEQIKKQEKSVNVYPQSKNLLKATFAYYRKNGFSPTVQKIFHYLRH